jgi:hypothetical protein
MARGDYFDVILRDTDPVRVQATQMGAKVALVMNDQEAGQLGKAAKPASPFITIYELNRADQPIRTFQFAKDSVIAITEGHATIKQARAK